MSTLATGRIKRANYDIPSLLLSSSPLPLSILPHWTHELNTADMNASKLEKVGIQLNHVANSTDMTASFLLRLTHDH